MVNIIESVRRWRARNAAISELRRMDDRLLADIGVSRADIPRIVQNLR